MRPTLPVGGANGSVNQKVLPLPTFRLVAPISPPCARTTSRRDVEPEPHPAALRPGHLEEPIEDPIEVLGRNALARVLDLESGPLARSPHANLHPSARRGVAHRIPEQVVEDDVDPLRVGLEREGLWRPLQHEFHPSCPRRGLRLPDGPLGQRDRVDGARVELDAARLDPRQVEDVVDDPLEPLAVLARRGHEVGLLGR